MPHRLQPTLLALFCIALRVTAHDNGFDDSMDMPMPLAVGNMLSYLHFTPGDVLWFNGWVPGKGSTLFAACVGIFLLGIAERWFTALRAGMELAVARDVQVIKKKKGSGEEKKTEKCDQCQSLADVLLMRNGTAAPFFVDHAWVRFIVHGAQATIAILIMLTLMTFQVSFIFSLAIGVGVGEMMYGRFTDATHAQFDHEVEQEVL
ncbi:hypothetical protein C0992_006049 [Termitomyces sp. T32_za158]|nr:hypothetical protein C0992_006049 [Termitomyces sp. T32_za158]